MTSFLPAPGEPLPHYVSTAPFDPYSVEAMTEEQVRVNQASQLRLMWWKFRRHKLALISGIFLVALYLMILICEFLAPYNLHTRNVDFIYAPPQSVRLFHEGQFIGPFVYGRTMELDMETLRRTYTDNPEQIERIRFFCRGDGYKFWGLFESNLHLVCPAKDGQLFLLGTDRLGRDVLSRIIYGARISLTIGLLGITVSFVLGIVIGGLAGYHGGVFDLIVQRVIEVLQSIPRISAVVVAGCNHAGDLEPDPDLSGHHDHWPSTGPGLPSGAFEIAGVARGGRRACRAIDGRQERPHHRPPSGSGLHVSLDRHRDDLHPRHDPWRNGAELPWLGLRPPSPAGVSC